MKLATILLLGLALHPSEEARKTEVRKERNSKARAEVEELIASARSGNHGQSTKNKHGNSLRMKHEVKYTDEDITVTRLDQLYEGIPVFGGHVIQVEVGGKLYSTKLKSDPKAQRSRFQRRRKTGRVISGHLIEGLSDDLGRIEAATASEKSIAAEACRNVLVRRGIRLKEEGKVQVESIIHVGIETGSAQQAFHCAVPLPLQGSEPNFILSKTWVILEEWDGVVKSSAKAGTGPSGNWRTGKKFYGVDYPKFDVQIARKCTSKSADGTCSQEQEFCVLSAPFVNTVNLAQTYDYVAAVPPFEYPCYDHASDEINGGFSPLNDAHSNAVETLNMFKEWYGENPVREQLLTVSVHYGKQVENAFYVSAHNKILIGDGNTNFHPLTTLSILAHEIAHGITHKHSGLIYSGQSGGINEAFSDMTAMAAIRFSRGLDKVTFRIGDDVRKGGGQLRCMDQPRCDGRSIDHISKYTNGMDPHYSSGLFNLVFYKLSKKLAYDVWDAYDIFYTANKLSWTPNTTFLEAAEAILETVEFMKAAESGIYNYDHLNMDVIVGVFKEVGITCTKSPNWDCV